MVNACFRCKSPIESGATFCRSCRDVASLEFAYTQDSRLWVVVLGAPALGLLSILAAVAYDATVGASQAVITGAITIPLVLGLPFVWALYLDCKHVRRRDDTDWEPSPLLTAFAGFFSVAVLVPMFVLGPYHCYRRKQKIGLKW